MNKNITFQRLGVLLAYPLAYTYIRLIFFTFGHEIKLYGMIGQGEFEFNLAYPIFTIFFILVNEFVRRGRREATGMPPKGAIFWYLMMILSSVTAAINPQGEYSSLPEVSVFAMHLCAVYSVLASNELLLGGKTSGFIIADLIHGFYVKSFAGFPNFVIDWGSFRKPQVMTGETTEGDTRKNRISAVVFVGVMILLMIISVNLMSSIDPDIKRVINNMFGSLFDYLGKIDAADIIARLVFAVPVCFYLYGLMSRSAKSDGSREKNFAQWLLRVKGKGKTVSSTLVYIASGIFVVGYILFFVKRFTYMLGGFAGDVPEGMLVSKYAINGFWELVGIMAVNLCVYIAIILLGKTDSDGKFSLPSKILVTLLMIESIIFAAMSMSKICLYYSIYGYTPKRILAMWATLSLGFAAVMTIITVNKGKPHFRAGVIFTTISYIAICFLSIVLVAIGA